MLIKPRKKPPELVIMEHLFWRGSLSRDGLRKLQSLQKGYDGELAFDALLAEKLKTPCHILHDLLLKLDGSFFQIDTMLIFSHTIYIFDIKNYEGEFYYQDEKLYKRPKRLIKDPLLQLERCHTLLQQLLNNLAIKFPAKASLVFINPDFTLYQAPMNKPIILPTQLTKLLKDLNRIPSQINDFHHQLAAKFKSLHVEEYPYSELPDYEYDDAKKGVLCGKCHSLDTFVEGKLVICRPCGHKELLTDAVIRCTEELMILYPGLRITVQLVYDWVKIVKSKQRIGRILGKNFKSAGKGRWMYYERW